MKRKINNPGRQVRSQEEIDARREARRKYYEEWEAFERELPDFMLRILDILRRSGMYDEVAEFASNCAFEDSKDRAVCDFQIKKAKERDKKCYRLEDVVVQQ